MPIEFVDDDGGDALGASALDGGHRDAATGGRTSRPVLAMGTLAALALVALAAFVVTHGPSSTRPAALSTPPVSGATTSGSGEASLPLPPGTPRGRPLTGVEQQLVTVYARAHDPTPAADIVRSGAASTPCTRVDVGSSTERAAVAVARAALPAFRERDYARIIDQYAGLCAAELRGTLPGGAVLIARVTSPTIGGPTTSFNAIEEHVAQFGGARTECVQLTSPSGWTVLAGVSAPRRAAASWLRALAAIASDTRLRWGPTPAG